jgi:hypothetical protein
VPGLAGVEPSQPFFRFCWRKFLDLVRGPEEMKFAIVEHGRKGGLISHPSYLLWLAWLRSIIDTTSPDHASNASRF